MTPNFQEFFRVEPQLWQTMLATAYQEYTAAVMTHSTITRSTQTKKNNPRHKMGPDDLKELL